MKMKKFQQSCTSRRGNYVRESRESIPALIGIAGVSGSGKTYSALLMAAGLAGESGKVGMIDSEAGRGAMYADDPDVIAAMPGEVYYREELNQPFSPQNYLDAMQRASEFGITALVVDSMTHEWEGFGGCSDIAENNKLRGMPNWALAKMQHKRMMNFLTQSRMHIICCLRAREKTKPVKDEKGKIEMVEMGLQPIQEKNFMFEMTASFMLDGISHQPHILKCPKPLLPIFTGITKPIDKGVGLAVKAWCDGGAKKNTLPEYKQLALDAAMRGHEVLGQFWMRYEPEQRETLQKKFGAEFLAELQFNADEFAKSQAPASDDNPLGI